jgi:choline dehydrogenase-like flavoprotein
MDDAADILIIGSGAAGAAAAWRLSAAGFKVVCLEQGKWLDPKAIPSQYPDWEIRRQREFHPNPNVRRMPADYPVEDGESAIKPLMYNGVGGSTIMWSSHAPRFHPSDFRVRSLDGVGDDWPLTYDELEPYYDLNDRMTGVAGLAGDPANPPRSPRQTPPVPLGRGGARMAKAFDKLGWHWWPGDININTRPYGDGRGACVNCGPCELGCVHKAKNSSDVTYWPQALKNGATLKTDARVYQITTDEQGRATGALYYDPEGHSQHQPAQVVILACNGVGTPRLLLLSRSALHPDGLANSSGLVGKRLMLHPVAVVAGVFDEMLEGWKGITAVTFLSQEFYETDTRRGFARGFGFQVTRAHGPLITALGGWADTIPWGQQHHAVFEERFGHMLALAVLTEDLPDDSNTVTLDTHLTDQHGIPAPKMTYKVDGNTQNILNFGIARSQEVLDAAAAKHSVVTPLLAGAGFHLMGTARMGDDRRASVVNRWGQAHDVDNLYVIDGSLFVTSAAVNPTPTIQALALRTADHIIQNRRNMRSMQ